MYNYGCFDCSNMADDSPYKRPRVWHLCAYIYDRVRGHSPRYFVITAELWHSGSWKWTLRLVLLLTDRWTALGGSGGPKINIRISFRAIHCSRPMCVFVRLTHWHECIPSACACRGGASIPTSWVVSLCLTPPSPQAPPPSPGRPARLCDAPLLAPARPGEKLCLRDLKLKTQDI